MYIKAYIYTYMHECISAIFAYVSLYKNCLSVNYIHTCQCILLLHRSLKKMIRKEGIIEELFTPTVTAQSSISNHLLYYEGMPHTVKGPTMYTG